MNQKIKRFRKFVCVALVLVLTISGAQSAVAANVIEPEETAEAMEARVRNELLTGRITNGADILAVALDHLEPSVPVAAEFVNRSEADGITTIVNDAGQLQIMQVLDSANAQALFHATAACNTMKYVACTTLLVLDKAGNEINETIVDGDFPGTIRDTGGLSAYQVSGIHTAFFTYNTNTGLTSFKVKLDHMITILTYGGDYSASKIVHTYAAKDNVVWTTLESDSTTHSSPTAGRGYSFYPTASWYAIDAPCTILTSKATVTVSGSTFELATGLNLGYTATDVG